MSNDPRSISRRLILSSLPMAAGLLLSGAAATRGSIPARAQRPLVAQAQTDAAPASPADTKPLDEQTKHKARSAVLLLSLVAGIALSGLLIIIVAITVRGLRRKLAGPTRLDQEPQDILPDVSSPPRPAAPTPAEPSGEGGSAAQETQFT